MSQSCAHSLMRLTDRMSLTSNASLLDTWHHNVRCAEQVGHGSLPLASLATTTAWANPIDVVFTDDSSNAVATLAIRVDICERVPSTTDAASPSHVDAAVPQGDGGLGPLTLEVALRVEVGDDWLPSRLAFVAAAVVVVVTVSSRTQLAVVLVAVVVLAAAAELLAEVMAEVVVHA